MSHQAGPCQLFHDPLDDVTELLQATPAVSEVLDLLDLNPQHLSAVRLSRAELRRVHRLRTRLATVPAPRPAT